MTGVEIAEKISAALETHHMNVETDIYYFVGWMGEVIDLFNAHNKKEANNEIKRLSDEIDEWYKELE